MIYLGYDELEKNKIINEYCINNNIKKIFILSPLKYNFPCSFHTCEFVEWEHVINYDYFYRLLQEINSDVLVVVNECLRTKNRNDLTYNCIRHYLNQTNKQIIFQYLPIIDSLDDFFILFDFDTRSKWKKQKDVTLLKDVNINIKRVNLSFNKIEVEASENTKKKYIKERDSIFKIFEQDVTKDPHVIPRNLYLLSGIDKLKIVKKDKMYLGRSNRFNLDNFMIYKKNNYNGNFIIFEFCHNYIDFIDFLTLTKQVELDILVSDLKVDSWYFERYKSWLGEIENAYTNLQ